jgi:hypothetical protein
MQMNSSEINNFFIVTSIVRPVAPVEALVAVVGHRSGVTAIAVSAITVPRCAGRFNHPMPEDIYEKPVGADERKKYGNKNWYDWSCLQLGN